MKENLNQDSPLHLADALADEIVNAPNEGLLDEVAEDLGDRRALASEFDAVFGRALRQSRRKHVTKVLKELAGQMSRWLSYKPIWVPAGTLAVVAVAVIVYRGQEDRRVAMQGVSAKLELSSRQPRAASPVVLDNNELGSSSALNGKNPLSVQAAAPPSARMQTNLEKAQEAHATALAYAQALESKSRATDALNRRDFAEAVVLFNEAIQSCANLCASEFRNQLTSDLSQAQIALKTINPVAVAAPASASAKVSTAAPVGALPSLAWPVKGHIISRFGERTATIVNPSDQAHRAVGITIAVPRGADVHAAGDGVVSYVGPEKTAESTIRVRHDDDLVTGYGHLRDVGVKVGNQVHRGEVIAKAGRSGRTAESELYFEVRQGNIPVDPLKYLPKDQ